MASSSETGGSEGSRVFAAKALRKVVNAIQKLTGPWTRANGVSWLKLIVFVLILRWAFVELYSIPSGSMEPTLHGDPRFLRGDRVAVNKSLFGPRVPFTTMRLLRFGVPERWDVVVFNAVDPNAEHPVLIKRVVGLPGERIQIRNGSVYADGKKLIPPKDLQDRLEYTRMLKPSDETVRTAILQYARRAVIPDKLNTANRNVQRLEQDILTLHSELQGIDPATLSEEKRSALLEDVDPISFTVIRELLQLLYQQSTPFKYGILKDEEYSVVPDDHYFMLGDNSKNSVDSRYFGWVPHKNLYGRAFAVVLPPGRMQDLTGFSSTWWGLALLLGIPIGLVLYETLRAFVVFSWTVKNAAAPTGLRRGEHVLINRTAVGIRIPFTSQRYLFKKLPSSRECVAYLTMDKSTSSAQLHFGATVRDREDSSQTLLVYTPNDENSRTTVEEISRDRLVGSVVAVWWPLTRCRRLRPQRDSEAAQAYSDSD